MRLGRAVLTEAGGVLLVLIALDGAVSIGLEGTILTRSDWED
jgi:hypothetical protein